MVIIQEIDSGYHTGVYTVVIIQGILSGYHVGIASGYRAGVWWFSHGIDQHSLLNIIDN